MKTLKRLAAILSLVILISTCFMPIVCAVGLSGTIAHFTFEANVVAAGASRYLVVRVNVAELDYDGFYGCRVVLNFDDKLLTFDRAIEVIEDYEFNGNSQVNCENGAISYAMSSETPIGVGAFLAFRFDFDVAVVGGKTVAFDLEVPEIQTLDNTFSATAEGCSFTFEESYEPTTDAHFTSQAYIETINHNDYLVVEVSVAELTTDIAACAIDFEFNDELLAFDHIEVVFKGLTQAKCEGGTVKFVMATYDPVTECGAFLKLYFTYKESEVIGQTVDFDLDVYEIQDYEHDYYATAKGCSYTFEANYGEETVFSSEAYLEGDFIVVQVRLDQLSYDSLDSVSGFGIALNLNTFLVLDHYEEMGTFMGESEYIPCECNAHFFISQKRSEPQKCTGRFLKYYFRYDKYLIGETIEFSLEAHEYIANEKVYAKTSGCEITLYHKGDINGDKLVNTGDAVCLLRHITGEEVLDNEQLLRADINGDGIINTGDATKVLMLSVDAE